MLNTIEISILKHCQWRHGSWCNDVSLKQFYEEYPNKNTWKFVPIFWSQAMLEVKWKYRNSKGP